MYRRETEGKKMKHWCDLNIGLKREDMQISPAVNNIYIHFKIYNNVAHSHRRVKEEIDFSLIFSSGIIVTVSRKNKKVSILFTTNFNYYFYLLLCLHLFFPATGLVKC